MLHLIDARTNNNIEERKGMKRRGEGTSRQWWTTLPSMCVCVCATAGEESLSSCAINSHPRGCSGCSPLTGCARGEGGGEISRDPLRGAAAPATAWVVKVCLCTGRGIQILFFLYPVFRSAVLYRHLSHLFFLLLLLPPPRRRRRRALKQKQNTRSIQETE